MQNNKPERTVYGTINGDIVIGSPVHIKLRSGQTLRTSPVVGYLRQTDGIIWIETRNSMYKVTP